MYNIATYTQFTTEEYYNPLDHILACSLNVHVHALIVLPGQPTETYSNCMCMYMYMYVQTSELSLYRSNLHAANLFLCVVLVLC